MIVQLTLPDADAIDFVSLFKKQNPYNLRILTALRMNATFPYVLPNVWLPTNPVIDVMDAGLRDNYGQETSLRFLQVFKSWIAENTSGVLLIQITDRPITQWAKTPLSNSILQPLITPFLLLQKNWHILQAYFEKDQLNYWKEAAGSTFRHFNFQYVASSDEAHASLSFHLTPAEKADIAGTLDNPANAKMFEHLLSFLK